MAAGADSEPSVRGGAHPPEAAPAPEVHGGPRLLCAALPLLPTRGLTGGLCAQDGNDSGTDAQHTAQDGRLLAKLNKYWEWIQEEPRIVGLNPYHWDDTNACTLKNTSACTHMCYVRPSDTFSICCP